MATDGGNTEVGGSPELDGNASELEADDDVHEITKTIEELKPDGDIVEDKVIDLKEETVSPTEPEIGFNSRS